MGVSAQEESVPLSRLSDSLCESYRQFQEPLARLQEADSLALMAMAAWTVDRLLAVGLLEEGLRVRAGQPTTWPLCASCERRLQSKGWRERVLYTLFGPIRWQRHGGERLQTADSATLRSLLP